MILNMKLGAVTKLDKRNKPTSKNFDNDVISGNCDVLSFFKFLANLEQPGDRIPDTESAKGMFSVKATFFVLQKLKTELKNL